MLMFMFMSSAAETAAIAADMQRKQVRERASVPLEKRSFMVKVCRCSCSLQFAVICR